MIKKLLTIAIPTYNRVDSLKKILELLVKYDDIEILISDNDSSDSTRNYCETLVNNNFQVSYFHNDKNLGFDLNVLNCLNKCKTEYIWFFSDDDFVEIETIIKVIELIKKFKFDALLLNSSVHNIVDSSLIIDSLNDTEDVFISDVQSIDFVKYIFWSTLISSLVIKCSIVDKSNLISHYGLELIQHAILWKNIKGKKLFILGSTKIKKNNGLSDNFNTRKIELWTKNWINSIWLLKDIYGSDRCKDAAITLYQRDEVSSLRIQFFMAKAFKLLSNKQIIDLSKKIRLSNIDQIFIVIILSVPNVILKYIYILVRKVKMFIQKFNLK